MSCAEVYTLLVGGFNHVSRESMDGVATEEHGSLMVDDRLLPLVLRCHLFVHRACLLESRDSHGRRITRDHLCEIATILDDDFLILLAGEKSAAEYLPVKKIVQPLDRTVL